MARWWTYKDEDGNGVSGSGMLCIDGGFEIPSDGPAVVTVQDFELPPGSSVDVADGKTLAIEGDLAFGSTDPASVSGLVELSGSMAQTISGDGATLVQSLARQHLPKDVVDHLNLATKYLVLRLHLNL